MLLGSHDSAKCVRCSDNSKIVIDSEGKAIILGLRPHRLIGVINLSRGGNENNNYF